MDQRILALLKEIEAEKMKDLSSNEDDSPRFQGKIDGYQGRPIDQKIPEERQQEFNVDELNQALDEVQKSRFNKIRQSIGK